MADSYNMSDGAIEVLNSFRVWYAPKHGWLSVIICSIGIVFNLFNIIVLTRKHMINTTNVLLMGLAVSDLMTMASYVVFAYHFYCRYGVKESPARNTHAWACFFLFHVNFTVTVHTISIFLGVALAIFRFLYVRLAVESRVVCNLYRARCTLVGVSVGAVVILVPNYMSIQLVSKPTPGNQTLWDINGIARDNTYGFVLTTLNFWIHALLVKLIPCALMSIFGFILVRTMRRSQRRRQQLKENCAPLDPAVAAKSRSRSRENTRTTLMLVIVIILFLVTELPQGILAVCSGLIPGFHGVVYEPLGDLMDAIALINNGINFALYCAMSRAFRVTFVRLFSPSYMRKQRAVAMATRNMTTHGETSPYMPIPSPTAAEADAVL